MKVTNKHIGKMVKVIPDPDQSVNDVLFDYGGQPWAIPVTIENWIDYIDGGFNPYLSTTSTTAFPPEGIVGLMIDVANVAPNVSVNWAKVLFPKMVNRDPDAEFILPQFQDRVYDAGAYWIHGDFLEIVEPEET